MIPKTMSELATAVGAYCLGSQRVLATAESCTGGAIAAAITSEPGSSAWFDCGFVTYSNDAKRRLLGVQPETLQQFGAVSKQTVLEMARGALHASNANISLVSSGIAGPGGGTREKPVGTVWLAWGWREGDVVLATEYHFTGDRQSVREQAVRQVFESLLTY